MTNVAAAQPMPAPDAEQRDDIGRLVAVTWHGGAGGIGSAPNRWWVAVDGSECSLRAVAMAARLTALDPDTAVDVVHVQPWLVMEAAETDFAPRGWAVTQQARHLLEAASVRWRVHVVMGEAASQIVRLTETPGTRGIVIGSNGLSATQALLLGSVSYKVALQVKVPIMIVR